MQGIAYHMVAEHKEALMGPESPEEEGLYQEIATRFGNVRVNPENAITFAKGLPGLSAPLKFCLAPFPNSKFEQFKLLQSLDDLNLSFIVLPLDLANPVIEKGDLEEGCKALRIETNNLLSLLIVSVHRSADAVKLSVNARAPILVDVAARTGEQYVFANNKYEIRHMISSEN